jgi:hypothetical protein
LERALNYPKSRPAGGGFATLAGAMFGRFHGWVLWAGFLGRILGPNILVMAE